MDNQKAIILGKSRPTSSRPKNIYIPVKQDDQLPCIKRFLPTTKTSVDE